MSSAEQKPRTFVLADLCLPHGEVAMTCTPVFLKGPKGLVQLRLLSLDDLEGLVIGANNPDMQDFLGGIRGPVSESFEKQWLEKAIEPTTSEIVLGVVESATGELAGSMGLHHIDHVNGIASTGAFFWNTDCLGHGLGTDAKFALLHWAFSAMPLRKICSSVLSSNPRSKAYQEKTGYRESGRRKAQYYRNGEYVDEIIMEVFRDDFMLAYEQYTVQ